MSTTIYFAKYAKKRNSTYQAAFNTSFDVVLKAPTSIDNPTVTLEADNFDYNLAKWGDNYYFVDRVVSVKNRIWEITLIIDALATVKADILASTQYVAYSSEQGNAWLADTRIPVLRSTLASKNTTPTGILSRIGCYVLSVVGKSSAATYVFQDDSTIKGIIDEIDTWESQGITAIESMIDATDTDTLLESIAKVLTNTGFVGNAYSNAPSCIRSCVWLPFDYARAPITGQDNPIYLGNFPTNKNGQRISSRPLYDSVTVAIPWHFSDWRRGYCEDVYLYLPLVGMVSISADSITNVSSLTIDWSVTYTDGCISYEVKAGNEIIGTYGGNCCANYPIGINQQASAGEIAQAFIGGLEKTISAGINSSISPVSAATSVAGMAAEATIGAYEVQNVASSSHPSCVGGIGGGAGVGLDLNITCYTVAHNTIVNPDDMKLTMGLPTMKPVQLSTLSGYCQCVNAHVQSSVHASVLDAVDAYLNSGFYIE